MTYVNYIITKFRVFSFNNPQNLILVGNFQVRGLQFPTTFLTSTFLQFPTTFLALKKKQKNLKCLPVSYPTGFDSVDFLDHTLLKTLWPRNLC